MSFAESFIRSLRNTRRMFRGVLYACILAGVPWFITPSRSEPTNATMVSAPAIKDCHTKKRRDLGLWDDVIACKERGLLILRRGEDLFLLPMNVAEGDPVKTSSVVGIGQGHFSSCVARGDKLWALVSCDDRDPFIVDARNGFTSKFQLPGPMAGKKPCPSIQSFVIILQAEAAFVEVSGGDPATWPRDGNRPLYFWVNLRSGQVKSFPVGWDLSHFTPDQSVAIFDKQETDHTGRRLLQGVDSSTGIAKDIAPNQFVAGGTIPYDWTYTRLIKPVYLRHEASGGLDLFAGLSVAGRSFSAHLHLGGEVYLSKAEADDGYAGFKLRHSGEVPVSPAAFYMLHLDGNSSAKLVADQVADFSLLGGGQCVFTTIAAGSKDKTEAFYTNSEHTAWNVLDGIERLPKLNKALLEKPYIEDAMTAKVVEGCEGNEAEAFTICSFTQYRRDMRSFISSDTADQPTIDPATWRRTIIVTSKGDRYLTDLFREENAPDYLWLNKNGRMVTGVTVWTMPSEGSTDRQRKVHLEETTLAF